MDFYDVKNGVNFVKYINTIENVTHEKGGLIVAGTTETGRFRGVRRPMYILLIQWQTLEQVECFNAQVGPILRDAGAACSTRVVFEMEPFCSPSIR